MLGADGRYLKTPPKWPEIQADPDHVFNLWNFVDMGTDGPGKVYGLDEFEQEFGA